MNREEEIRKEIWKIKQENGNRKWKLTLKTWAVLSIVLYVSAFASGSMNKPLDYLTGIVLSVIMAVVIWFVSIIVMTPVLIFREDEVTTLTRLRTELDLIEKGLLRYDDKE